MTQQHTDKADNGTVEWRLLQVEKQTEKMEDEVNCLGIKMTTMEVTNKAILSTQIVIKNAVIVLVVSNILMYFVSMWVKYNGWELMK